MSISRLLKSNPSELKKMPPSIQVKAYGDAISERNFKTDSVDSRFLAPESDSFSGAPAFLVGGLVGLFLAYRQLS